MTFIFSCIIAVSKKRIYEGGFEIVLDTKSKVNNGLISSPIAQLANITGVQTNNLKTEVKILESPSVLMPIYENVIKKKGTGFTVKAGGF